MKCLDVAAEIDNVFDIFGIGNNELVVSNLFAYWFKQSKDFLNKFLNKAKYDPIPEGDDYEVIREYHPVGKTTSKQSYIDMLIKVYHDKTLDRVIVIENKVFSSESENQTARYFDDTNKDFPDSVCQNKSFIFFTFREQEASHEHFLTLEYKKIKPICEEYNSLKYMKDFCDFYFNNLERVIDVLKRIFRNINLNYTPDYLADYIGVKKMSPISEKNFIYIRLHERLLCIKINSRNDIPDEAKKIPGIVFKQDWNKNREKEVFCIPLEQVTDSEIISNLLKDAYERFKK